MKYSKDNNELMLLSLTIKIIEVIYQMIEGKTQAQIDKRIYIMLEYIHNNCHKDISLDDLCRSINVSRNTVTNIFMKYMNEGFSSYLNRYRLKKAIILLRSDMNISEISSKIGYNSVGYFVKKFKSFYGITPGEYRKKYQ